MAFRYRQGVPNQYSLRSHPKGFPVEKDQLFVVIFNIIWNQNAIEKNYKNKMSFPAIGNLFSNHLGRSIFFIGNVQIQVWRSG